MATSVRADTGERTALDPASIYFAVYAGAGTDPATFQYPDGPTDFRGFDPNGSLFDTTEILQSPNGNVLHYDFHFTPDNSIVGPEKPYILIHEGDGQYLSRGQVVEFDVDETPPQFEFLTPGTWRAVGLDILQLDRKGGQFEWAVTRVDFYRCSDGHSEYALSLVYLLWDDGFGPDVTDPANPQRNAPQVVVGRGRQLIESGPRITPIRRRRRQRDVSERLRRMGGRRRRRVGYGGD